MVRSRERKTMRLIHIGFNKDGLDRMLGEVVRRRQQSRARSIDLGSCYYGAGGRDYAKRSGGKSAEQNNAKAQYNLGVAYRDGLGVTKV